MSNQLNELILQLSISEAKLLGTLLASNGQVLAQRTVELDVAKLRDLETMDEYGNVLTEAVLGGEIGQALQQAQPTRVRLVTVGDLSQFQEVRWECMQRQTDTGSVPLATGSDTPFSRLLYPDSTTRAREPKKDWPLRIVVAISNPSNLTATNELSPLNVELEKAELKRSLEELKGLVEVTFVEPPVSLDSIFQALEREVDIFHFLGHGGFDEQTGKAALVLEKEDKEQYREIQIVEQDVWINRLRMLSKKTPHLTVLAACNSGKWIKADERVGFAPALIEAGSGAVVAMQDYVGIEAARKFTYHFYRRLAQHGEIDLAANEARSYLLDPKFWRLSISQKFWHLSIPTVFLERGAERIFAVPPDELEYKSAQPGETLILIAEFKGHEEAFFEPDLRDKLEAQVKAKLKDANVVWLRDKKTAFGPGEDDNIRRLAARYGATLVIWGWFDRSGFRACFTVTESLFAYHDPLVFRSNARYDEKLQSDDDFAVLINTKLSRQVEYFVFFTLGQLHYWGGNYEQALAALQQAITTVEADAQSKPPEGLAYAYFYRGNLNAVYRQERLAAIADYRRALELVPNFATAAYCLGESLRILANTHRDIMGDEPSAQQAYRQAIEAYSRTIDINPDYVLPYEGRGLANWEIGMNEAAVEDYTLAVARQPRAETYNKLGLTLRDLDRQQEALAQFDQAIAYAPGTGYYYLNRGRLRARLGDESGAIADLEAYLRLSPDAKNRDRVEAWLNERRR